MIRFKVAISKRSREFQRWIRTSAQSVGLLATIVFAGMCIYELPRVPLVVRLVMNAEAGARGEIFYRNAGTGFTQRDSVAFPITDDGSLREYAIELPASTGIENIRIDPGVQEGDVTIHLFEVKDAEGAQEFDGRSLFEARGRVNQARLRVNSNGQLLLESLGTDPYFEFSLHRPVGQIRPLPVMSLRLFVALATALTLVWITTGLSRVLNIWSGAGHRLLPKPAHAVDGELLVFTPSVVLAFSVIFVAACLYVALKLNQSSIEAWERAYPDAPVEQMIDVGAPRLIRSDEWKVQTPWVLNQFFAGSPNENRNLGGATAPVIASVPISDPIGLPNLKYAGFRFLDVERGFSWFWAYKSFGLAFSFLWLLLVLTRGSLPSSIVGTAWIYFSSYTQWWFSSGLPEILTAFALGTTGALYTLYSSRRPMIGVGAVLIFVAASNLVWTLYPPFVVSLGYLAIAIVVGYGLEIGVLATLTREKRFRAIACAATLAAVAAYGVWFLNTGSSAIQAMLETIYPGRRIASSGGVPLSKLMDGFFEAFRIGENTFPRLPLSYNASEASGHLVLLPFLLFLVPLGTWFRRENALLPSIAGFCAIACAWVVIQLPGPINDALQLAGWYAVTPKRAIMAFGVGAILLCTVLLAKVQASPSPARPRTAHWIAVPVISLAVAWFGWRLRHVDPIFFSGQVLALGTLVTALIALGIARGNTALMAAGVAILALPGITVNPLTSGLSSLMEKPVLAAAKEQGGAPGDRWLVIGDNFLAQGLKGVGLDVFGGTHYVPDLSVMDRLDPRHAYAQVWNRYSTISVLSDPGTAPARFELLHPDQYRIVLDVCSRIAQDVGITHIAYTVVVPQQDLACLEPISAPEGSGVRLFRIKSRPMPSAAAQHHAERKI